MESLPNNRQCIAIAARDSLKVEDR
jgi:hypothetical protein